jgi:ribosome-binding protein aMBF1 (putative translation factor)
MSQLLISRKQLAERWSLSVETLKRRERAGILPALKMGRGVRYRLHDIERIEQQAEVRR